MKRPSPRLTTTVPALAVVLLAVTSCGDSGDDTASSTGVDTTAVDSTPAVVADEAFPDERCALNEDAGTITFLTGFDFAAASSIIEVIAADEAGYYDDLCLDVEVLPGFSSANYAQVASGTAQFASGGSFSEVVEFSDANDARFLATTVDGRSAIDTLMVKPAQVTELADLAGTTIGVKGKLPPSIEVMLRGADLEQDEDFDTVLLDGFDPLTHIAIDRIVGLPGWKSNEVGALDRAGIGVRLFDPLDFGVPGSFGVIFTSADFVEEHPTAAQDFVRATSRGLTDAVAAPESTALVAVDLINGGGNPNFLSPEGEVFRWETEARLVMDGTPEGSGLGVPDIAVLQDELDAYGEVGLFGGSEPDAADFVAEGLAASVHDDTGVVIWPAD